MKKQFSFALCLATIGATQAHAGSKSYIIKLKSGTEYANSERILSEAGIEATAKISQLNLVVGNIDDANTQKVRASASSIIEYIEPNITLHATMGKSKDPYSESSGLWGMKTIGAREAWGKGVFGSKSIVVAVSDTGVWSGHPDLADNMWKNPREIQNNKIDDDGNGLVDDIHGWNFSTKGDGGIDDNGHGTHVAGTIGAVGGNGEGLSGVSWNVSIMAVKFLDKDGSGTLEGGIRTILYASDNGARIINASWGAEGEPSQSLKEAIEYAQAKGVLLIAAAGNGDRSLSPVDTDRSGHYPSAYDNENIISVAALRRSTPLGLTSWSNYGRTSVDIAAPGEEINSTWYPHASALNKQWYRLNSGTSMASPHVAGAAALVLSANPSLNWRQLKAILLETATPVSSFQNKMTTGGYLNVGAAVQRALDSR